MGKLASITILFLAKFALAQSFYTVCTPLPTSPTVAEINNFNSCVASNRASAQSSGTAAASSFTLSGTTVVQPLSGTSEQNDIYTQNTNLNTLTPLTPLTAAQTEATSITTTSAVGSLVQIMRANTEGETNYLVTAESAYTEGLGNLSLAGECASASTSACYNQRSELYATGAAFLLVQRQAEDQVGQHQRARSVACEAKNQLSSEQQNCGSALDNALSYFTGSVATSASGITVTVNPSVASAPLSAITYNALTGSCSPPTAPGCLNLSRNVAPPSLQLQQAVREILKKKYAGNKTVTVAAQNLFSKNADGSISVKGGSTYAKQDFSDATKLKAKGLSDTFAQNIMKKLTSWMTPATTSSAKATAASASTQITEDASSTMITTAATAEIKILQESMPVEEYTEIEREPASLKKQIGEEFIGVAKDDIFKIINRRYKSEEKDDYFY